jgi:hypothetical protein
MQVCEPVTNARECRLVRALHSHRRQGRITPQSWLRWLGCSQIKLEARQGVLTTKLLERRVNRSQPLTSLWIGPVALTHWTEEVVVIVTGAATVAHQTLDACLVRYSDPYTTNTPTATDRKSAVLCLREPRRDFGVGARRRGSSAGVDALEPADLRVQGTQRLPERIGRSLGR